MLKEVETRICTECGSRFKLTYDRTQTSGMAKFCPFCACELNDDDDEEESYE